MASRLRLAFPCSTGAELLSCASRLPESLPALLERAQHQGLTGGSLSVCGGTQPAQITFALHESVRWKAEGWGALPLLITRALC